MYELCAELDWNGKFGISDCINTSSGAISSFQYGYAETGCGDCWSSGKTANSCANYQDVWVGCRPVISIGRHTVMLLAMYRRLSSLRVLVSGFWLVVTGFFFWLFPFIY